MKFLFILTITCISALFNKSFGQKSPVHALEQRLMKGDPSALVDIAKYLDSKREVIEFLGHHLIQTNESRVAKRLLRENCIFAGTELNISDSLTSVEFLNFLNAHKGKITFSKLAGAFIITPLESRAAKVEFREISEIRKNELQARYAHLLANKWVKEAKIDSLIGKRDPKALLNIASELYKIRYRFNTHNDFAHEYTELLQILLGIEFAVENERNELTWHIDKEFYPAATLNLLIYFAGNYSKYKWNEQTSTFGRNDVRVKTIGREEPLFHLLNNESDSIALDAFVRLTTLDPAKVNQLADEYQKAGIDKNGAIPIFPYRFLKQLVLLTDYCRQHHIDFMGSREIQSIVNRLDSNVDFPERRKLEDSLINTLTLEEITAFEYWAAIREQSWGITHSAGRILDIFYSKHWNEILDSERQLKLFLKKAYLFDQIGIIGVCNNYLNKFIDNGDVAKQKLVSIQTNENDLKIQIERATIFCAMPLRMPTDTMKFNDGNRDYNLSDLSGKIRKIKAIGDQEKMEDTLVELLSQINYSQIGEALREIEDIKFKESSWTKYDFLESDFGFFMDLNFESVATRKRFLELYDKLSEYDLYSYYLDKAGIEYKNKDNTLNYDRIFDILKYNVVVAFMGGGGGRRDNEVYAVIKLLELTHNTTLGYPRKLCNSDGMYACYAQDRANEWMQVLKTKKLLKEQHNEPVSFHHE